MKGLFYSAQVVHKGGGRAFQEGTTVMGKRRGNVRGFKFPRARRYPIRLPVRYRPGGTDAWHEGRVANISQSGMLFETEHLVAVNTPVVMRFVLPATMYVKSPAEIVCHGKIVRRVLTSKRESTPALAATIANYRFRRRDLS